MRAFAFALLLVAHALAQSNCSTPCPKIEWLPISGRVLDATDGHPIVGATVEFQGRGDALSREGPSLNPPTLKGEIKTKADGSFTLPKLAPGGFSVRVLATGYLSEVQQLGEHPAGYKEQPLPSPPSSFCMARYGKPECPPIQRPDGVIRLQPDVLNLKPLSDAAQAAYSPPLPSFTYRSYIASGFSSDGERFGFVTLDAESQMGQAIVRRCIAWTYDLRSGALLKAELPEKSLPAGQYEQETDCSSNKNLTWSGDTYYFSTARVVDNPTHATVESVSGSAASAVSALGILPPSVQESLAWTNLPQTDKTSDGRFSLQPAYTGDEDQPHSGCVKLGITPPQPPANQTGLPGCGNLNYLLDRDRDLLFFTEPGTSGGEPDRFVALVEYDLLTAGRRTFSLPAFNRELKLLALQPMPDGATRLAYAPVGIGSDAGDCDLASSEFYPWPMPMYRARGDYRPDKSGHAPQRFSVCFVTIPPAQAQSSAPSQEPHAHP